MRLHRHRPSYWLTPKIEVDGAVVQPVRFRRCRCGRWIEPEITPTGKRLISDGHDRGALIERAWREHALRVAAHRAS